MYVLNYLLFRAITCITTYATINYCINNERSHTHFIGSINKNGNPQVNLIAYSIVCSVPRN